VLDVQPLGFEAHRALREASIARLRAGAVVSGRLFDFLSGDLTAASREALVLAAGDPACAESALRALTTRGDRESLTALGRLAQSDDALLAAEASCALASQPDSRSQRLLQREAQRHPGREAGAALDRIRTLGARPI